MTYPNRVNITRTLVEHGVAQRDEIRYDHSGGGVGTFYIGEHRDTESQCYWYDVLIGPFTYADGQPEDDGIVYVGLDDSNPYYRDEGAYRECRSCSEVIAAVLHYRGHPSNTLHPEPVTVKTDDDACPLCGDTTNECACR